MLSYVSIMKVEVLRKTVKKEVHYYRSPILLKEKDAKNWITNELKKYPQAIVDEYNNSSSEGTYIYTSTIAFDPKKTSNINDFLNKCDIAYS